MQPKKKGRLRRVFESSLIVSGIMRLVNWIYRLADTSIAGLLFSTDDSAGHAPGFVQSGMHLLYRKVLRPIQKYCVRSFDKSMILRAIQSLLDQLLFCSVKVYGSFFISLSLSSAAIWALRAFALREIVPVLSDLYLPAVILLLAMIARIRSGTLADALIESRVMSFLLFSVVGVRIEPFEAERTSHFRNTGAWICGILVGLFTIAVPLWLLLCGMLCLLILYTILIVPESGVVAIFFALPFLSVLSHPSVLAAAMVLYVTCCHLIKLLRGKRTFRMETVDGAVLVFLIMILCGGIVTVNSAASRSSALLSGCFILGYFLVVNLIRTPAWMHRCILAICTSSFFVSVFGIYQYVTGNVTTKWQDAEMFEEIKGRVTSFFDNPNVLAEYLIMTIFFAAVLLFTTKDSGKRVAAALACFAGAGCLLVTWSRGAWLGFFFGALIFLLIFSKKTMVLLLAGVAAIPFLPVILPDSIVSRFTSIGNLADSSTAYRMHIWQASLRMIEDFFASGVGLGIGAFQTIYPSYARAGIESAPHSHNLYFEILIELGVFGLLAFLTVVFLMIRKTMAYVRTVPDGSAHRETALLAAAGLSGVAAVMLQGMTDYVWYNYRIFLMMWLLIGLTVAISRCGREENRPPQEDACSIDIALDGRRQKNLSTGRKRGK